MDKYVVILAAGKGTRMKSDLPKVLHTLRGKPMIHYVLEAINQNGIKKAVVVVGYKKGKVIQSVNQWMSEKNPDFSLEYVEQPQMRGTGEAVLLSEKIFNQKTGRLLVLLGDVPGIKNDTIQRLFRAEIIDSMIPYVVSMMVKNPHGYGRIIRNNSGNVIAIREEKDASDIEKAITEVNTGIFSFPIPQIWAYLKKIQSNNNQSEYYLTDIIEIYRHENLDFGVIKEQNSSEFLGINSREQLNELEKESN